jgi:flagellar protein FlaG
MGLQISSLGNLGSIVVSAQQEFSKEKQTPLPMEEKVSSEKTESSLPGNLKSQVQDIAKTASALEQISLAFNRRMQFIIDQESREIIIKVIDNETDKVIKVLPPEELQRLHSRIRETIGFLFDRMV